MKKGLLYIIALVGCVAIFAGCIKNGTQRTINPAMVATIGSYTFNATTVQPSTVTPQINDTETTLLITGTDQTTGYKIVLGVTKYKGIDGTFSIVQGQASAAYYAGIEPDPASGGIVAINTVSNVVIGYFSFTTVGGVSVSNGTFTVGNPWIY